MNRLRLVPLFAGLWMSLFVVSCHTGSDIEQEKGLTNENTTSEAPNTDTDQTAATEKNPSDQTEKPTKDVPESQKKIQAAYAKWLKEKINSGEYISQADCGDFKLRMYNDDNFYPEDVPIGLPNDPEYKFGDLNQDGIDDGYAMAPIIQCDGGNALHSVEEIVVFVSQPDGSYLTLDDPSPWKAHGVGNVYDILNGEILGSGLDYEDDDSRCCPSLSWEVRYIVKDNKVVEHARTPVEKNKPD